MNNDYITKSIQAKELKMLKEISNLLSTNGIKFFLACGSALGCARHKGFIPWDDDVDIYIFGQDYEKFKLICSSSLSSNLELQDYTTVGGYPYSFPKIVAKDSLLIEKSAQS